MLSQNVCPSACLSHAGIVLKSFNVSINLLVSGSHTILVFPYQTLSQYTNGDPLTAMSNAGGMKELWLSTNISIYLEKDTRRAIVNMECQ